MPGIFSPGLLGVIPYIALSPSSLAEESACHHGLQM